MIFCSFFFFNDTATTEIYTLSLHDALPFFPLDHGLQGNRLLQIMKANPMEVYLLNTGRVGGGEGDARSLKVKIRHSSAIVQGIAEGTIRWDRDPDFGYEVASRVPGIDADD